MSEKATININGSSYDFPVYRGVEGDVCIDIKSLRAESGAMMYMTDGGEIFISVWVM